MSPVVILYELEDLDEDTRNQHLYVGLSRARTTGSWCCRRVRQVGGRNDDLPWVSASSLYINRDVELDWLIALPFGQVSDGQPDDCFRVVGDSFRWALDEPGGTPVGFEVLSLTEFDPAAQEYMELWHGPRFAAPLVALRNATAGEILLAVRPHMATSPR